MAIKPPSPSNTHLLPSLLIGVPFIDKEHDELVAQLDCLLSHPDALQDADRFSEVFVNSVVKSMPISRMKKRF